MSHVDRSHAIVDRGDLAAPRRELEQPDARREPPDDRVGAVDRAVGRDDDLEPVGRVVERERVLQLGLDHRRFVVGGDEQADARLDRRAP